MIWFIPTSEQETNRHTPYVTWTLVVLNVVAYIAMWLSSMTTKQWWLTYGLMPSDPHWWQYLTGNFVHAPNPLHLVGNMLFLVVFGDNVEDILGPLGFATLYFLGGLGGDVTFVASNPDLAIPSGGASGCIATIAGAYAVMFFNRAVNVDVYFFLFKLTSVAAPAMLLLLFYFGMDLWLTASGGGALAGGGGTNYVSHGVGFGLGLVVGSLALGSGAVARFRKHQQGHALFGYLPWNLGKRARWRG
jgi:membrane associated rhomboid family serine protease